MSDFFVIENFLSDNYLRMLVNCTIIFAQCNIQQPVMNMTKQKTYPWWNDTDALIYRLYQFVDNIKHFNEWNPALQIINDF